MRTTLVNDHHVNLLAYISSPPPLNFNALESAMMDEASPVELAASSFSRVAFRLVT